MRALLPLLALLMLPACAIIGPGEGGRVDDAADSVTEAQLRWQRLGWSSYDMIMGRWCFCVAAGEFRVSVRDHAVMLVTRLETDEVLSPDQFEWFPTIDDLFDLISELPLSADSFSVRYHETGYPESVRIDYLAQAVDDEINFEVRDVVAITSDDLFDLGLDQTAQIGSVSVGFHQLVSDSRCPSNVVCIWEGQAVVELRIDPGAGPAQFVRLVNGGRLDGDQTSATVGGVEVQLLVVRPYPEIAESPPDPSTYHVLIRVASVQ